MSISLADLIAWLETRQADEEYCYASNGNCLVAQYVKSKGYAGVSVGPFDCHYNWTEMGGTTLVLPSVFYDISFDGERTFGAALARARAEER